MARAFSAPGLPRTSNSDLHVHLIMGDALGSTSMVIDKDTSEVVEASLHDTYGRLESDYRPARWKNFREDYKFTGKEEDAEVGLVYFGARYYSPNLGRFISPDPLTIHAAMAGPNPYAYVHGRTSTSVDPWGLLGNEPVETPEQMEARFAKYDAELGAGAAAAKPSHHVSLAALEDHARIWASDFQGTMTRMASQRLADSGGNVFSLIHGTAPLPLPGGYSVRMDRMQATAARDALEMTLQMPGLLGHVEQFLGSNGRFAGHFGTPAAAGDKDISAGAARLLTAVVTGGAVAGDVAALGATRALGAVEGVTGGVSKLGIQSFEILDGVRRAKAMAELGHASIEAEVIVGDKVVQTGRIPLDALRSPKAAIELSNPSMMQRWLRVLQGTRAGDRLPPIRVQPGSTGTPVHQIEFIF